MRHIIIFGLLLMMGLAGAQAYASSAVVDDQAYAVKNIAVDVEAKNAIAAREQALTKARRDAFDVMVGRFLNVNDRANLGQVDDNTINSMVNDFEIKRERFSSNRYLASVDVRFNERAVQTYLGRFMPVAVPNTQYQMPVPQYGQYGTYPPSPQVIDPYIDMQQTAPVAQVAVNADPVGLVLPWFRHTGLSMLWHDTNPWMDAWKQWTQTDQAKQMRLLTPIGDITDMQIFNPEKPLSYDQSALMRLLDRYGADYAVIAIADPLPNGMVDIGLYQSTTSVPRFIDKIIAPTAAANSVAGYFPAIWQSAKRIAEAPRNVTTQYGDRTAGAPTRAADIPSFAMDNTVLVPFEAEIALSDIRQWVGIRQALSQLPGMQDMQVKSLSAARAVINFRYTGDVDSLNNALNNRGMNIYKNPVLTPGKTPYIITARQS